MCDFIFTFLKLWKVQNVLKVTVDKLCDKSVSFMSSRTVDLD